jgi:ACS family hexuronate transporter-like MFS transporter
MAVPAGVRAPSRSAFVARWTPVASMWLVSLISYIDRNTLALLAPTILQETGLTGEQYGLIIAGFSVAYTIGNPLWGRILDRIGLRRGMAAAVSMWTAASASHALASGFGGFAAARAALGFGEGATFPGGLRTVTQTLPPGARGRGIAVAYSGGSLGAIVTPLIVTPVFLAWGWRGAFIFTGAVGVAWLILWGFISRRPDVRAVPGREEAAAAGGAAPRLADPRLWSFMCAYALGALPIGFVLYGAAIYLAQALQQSQAVIGTVLWIPPVGWELGYFFWGWLADRGKPLGSLMAAAAVLCLPLAALPWAASLAVFMTGLFVVMFGASGFIVLSMAYGTRVFSSAHSSLVAGVGAGSWSAAVAVFMPVLGRLFDLHRYEEAFFIAAGFPAVGLLSWHLLDRPPRRPTGAGVPLL